MKGKIVHGDTAKEHKLGLLIPMVSYPDLENTCRKLERAQSCAVWRCCHGAESKAALGGRFLHVKSLLSDNRSEVTVHSVEWKLEEF